MTYLIIILLIFLILFYVYKLIQRHYNKLAINLSFWKNKYNDHHKEIIKFIEELVPYFEKYNITYWLHAGTLLGAQRHNGIIPWDDDVDFGFIDKDKNINILINELQNNYKIEYYFFGFKIINKNDNKIFIDMFEFTIRDNMAKQTSMSELVWPKENYYLDELMPIKKSKFESIILPIPSNPDKYCKRVFGQDYMDVFYINCPHYDTFFNNIIDGIGLSFIAGNKFNIGDLHY